MLINASDDSYNSLCFQFLEMTSKITFTHQLNSNKHLESSNTQSRKKTRLERIETFTSEVDVCHGDQCVVNVCVRVRVRVRVRVCVHGCVYMRFFQPLRYHELSNCAHESKHSSRLIRADFNTES